MFRMNTPRLYLATLIYFFSAAIAAQNINTLFRQAHDPVGGNPRGKITVVEFFDYQCSHCTVMGNVLATIIRNNPNVRVVFKEFPIRGEGSELAARAALAANKQGKYNRFNHALLNANQDLTESVIFQIAKSNGINVGRLKKDMDSPAITSILKANANLAQALKITGTPAFFIGKTNAQSLNNVSQVYGEMSPRELQAEINQASQH
ncbi:MAG: DsbA family protein [Gammaproteobacteria bacterium]|nr:DsbA family protein [Gammaproteobacteria bacterium]